MDLSERTSLLSGFLGCSVSSAETLARAAQITQFQPRSCLTYQGESCDQVWLIIEGIIQLRAMSAEGQVTIISAFGPGELVGGYEPDRLSPFDAYANTHAITLTVSAKRLQMLLEDHPDIARGLARIYSDQLFVVLDRLATRVTLSASGRFYQELLRSAGAADIICPPPVVSVLALSAQTTRETGSRAMSQLERRGIIERDGERLTIKSRAMLEELIE